MVFHINENGDLMGGLGTRLSHKSKDIQEVAAKVDIQKLLLDAYQMEIDAIITNNPPLDYYRQTILKSKPVSKILNNLERLGSIEEKHLADCVEFSRQYGQIVDVYKKLIKGLLQMDAFYEQARIEGRTEDLNAILKRLPNKGY